MDIENALRAIREAESKLQAQFKSINTRLDNQYAKTEELNRRVAALERKLSSGKDRAGHS